MAGRKEAARSRRGRALCGAANRSNPLAGRVVFILTPHREQRTAISRRASSFGVHHAEAARGLGCTGGADSTVRSGVPALAEGRAALRSAGRQRKVWKCARIVGGYV